MVAKSCWPSPRDTGIVGDGHLGIWSAVRHVYPEAAEQRCWNHRLLNVLDKLPKRQQSAAKALLCLIPYAPTRREAEQRRDQFLHWCQRHGYPDAARCLAADWDRLVVFYQVPQRTGNICGRRTPWNRRLPPLDYAPMRRSDFGW
jgi:transposase-like protein